MVHGLSSLGTVKDFDRLSTRIQRVRQEVMLKQIAAEGYPWSDERGKQVAAPYYTEGVIQVQQNAIGPRSDIKLRTRRGLH